MIKNVVKKIISPMLGRTITHSLFERLHLLGLFGMNIGGGSDYNQSGERTAARIVRDRLAGTGLSKDLVLFDVGAHVGGYSMMLADVFQESAVIHSFEPSSKTFAALCESVKSKPHIFPHNIGFGDKEEEIDFFSDAAVSELASVYKRDLTHYNLRMERVERVNLQTIDSFCQQEKIRHIHFLKLDVEGHELKVLQGARGLIETGNVDYIQFEFGPSNIDSRTYFYDLYKALSKRYAIYRIMKDGLQPIVAYSEMLEVFITSNYIAEKS